MSIRCVGWALNEAPVTEPVQVLVLVAMAERANDDGTSTYQSRATIAQKARISVRTVQRILAQLEEMGLIVRGDQELVSHFPANRRPVVYDIAVSKTWGVNLSPQDSDVPPVSPQDDPDVSQVSPQQGSDVSQVSPQREARGDIDDTLGVTRMAHNTSSNSSYITTPSSSVSTSPEPDLSALRAIAVTKFEEFWNAYPKQEGKQRAKGPYWAALQAGVDPDLITEKAKGYALAVKGKEREFIKLPVNWLGEERWTDTYPTPQPAGRRYPPNYVEE